MKILIGVDGSDYSRAAVQFVRKLTWPAGTKAIVLSAVQPVAVAYSEYYVAAIDEGLLAEERKAHEETVSMTEHDLREVGLDTDARVLDGDPSQTIVRIAKSEKVDLVIVGSHGRTGLAKLVMGSVASHVVSHLPCSVLVVRNPD